MGSVKRNLMEIEKSLIICGEREGAAGEEWGLIATVKMMTYELGSRKSVNDKAKIA